ncbi:SGNH hydrolase-type esterase domain-containing protein [Lophiotrema nucula]|uniref:SGNH hydrolase-type esterase domain-containing protein n=1 Tax=Lophiotrema nucula TaxID=690887 RepID=A0A6A5YVG2_9PLEO|nr:SGNH hydrolase-type esterase domain-containing protein [Lophiotrema nucula]
MYSPYKNLFLVVSLHLPLGIAYPAENSALTSRDGTYVWGAIGDSWGSGVSYNLFGLTDYDDNKDECLRINHAYSVKVSEDSSWVPDGKTQEFHFAACSGSRMGNMAFQPWRGYVQMDAVGRPGLITMQAGGNDVGFYNVATSCLFHVENVDYGPIYPDREGKCKKAIEGARDYVQKEGNPNIRALGYDMWKTIDDVMTHESHSDDPEFRLYVIGYGAFFNVDDDSTWCNNFSFVVPWHDRSQKLTLELRRDINDLVEQTNSKIEEQVLSFNNPKIGFIDVGSAFDGNRFCETGHSPWDQYFGNKVLLWNASPDGIILKLNNNYTERDTAPTQDEFDKWLATGMFTDDPNEITPEQYTTNDISFPGPKQGGLPGIILRPFHPKEDGHANMAKIIVDRIKADFAAQTPAPPQPTSTPPPSPPPKTHGFNIVFHNYIDEINNKNDWAFYAQASGNTLGNLCKRKPDSKTDSIGGDVGDIDSPPWPNGEWTVNGGEDNCKYRSDGSGPGFLRCPSMTEDAACVEDAARGGGKDATTSCNSGIFSDWYHAVAWCDW